MIEPVAVQLLIADRQAFDAAVDSAIEEQLASRIQRQDATLWGPDAESEAAIRLGWVTLATSSRELVDSIYQLRDEFRAAGLARVVLCGMGGSSLAPEVICRAHGVDLIVLDSSQPDMVRDVVADRLDQTVVVVSSKSGGTVETDSQRRIFEQAFIAAGIDPAGRIVVVTDPGSPLEAEATAAGYRVFAADPHVGGRYSALTAFGLVPSGLAGADLNRLLDEAAAATPHVFSDEASNPALRLGVAMALANRADVTKLVLADSTGNGLVDWIEQLVAESTGKQGQGVLPVVVTDADAPNFADSTPDSQLVQIGAQSPATSTSGFSIAIEGPLASLMLTWEVATAICGQLIGINPFDQPDVESAKAAARELLTGSAQPTTADATDGDIQLLGTAAASVPDAIEELLSHVDPNQGYFAIQAYLDRFAQADFAASRAAAARRIGRPVTFGWGPRFLHSTGQYHKGGPPQGVFLQVTCEAIQDVEVPGRDFTLGQFCASQADGDAAVLREAGRPVLRLHVTNLTALRAIVEALG